MNVCIVNGNPVRERDSLDHYLDRLSASLGSRACPVTRLDLRDLSIRYCTGCWGCWTKTPGECAARDDSPRVCREIIHSDLTLLGSPVLMGFPSALLKKAQDKLIPLLHPYLALVNGETHHRARYDRYARLGLLLHRSPDTDDEDIRIITRLLLEQFLDGFKRVDGGDFQLFYLKRTAEQGRFLEAFRGAEVVLLAFPLYVDAMPGLVKEFIESLAVLQGGSGGDARRPALGFMVQSGFPEAAHSRPVEDYNRKLAERLGCRYLGTIVKGGVEGIQVKPPWMTRKLFSAFHSLGDCLGRTGGFAPTAIAALARPERLSPAGRALYDLLDRIGLGTFYWDWMLKKNGAYERRFAKPYA